MRLNVNPNRMELLRLRKRLVLAERGHKLLKDKLEEIMRRFLELMRELTERQAGLGDRLNRVFTAFALARGGNSREELEALVPEGTEVPTLAVGAAMAAYNWPREHARYRKVKRFVDLFFGNFDGFQEAPYHAKWQEVDLSAEVPGWQRFAPAQEWLAAKKLTN